MAIDSSFVIYTGVNLPYIDVVSTDNDNLQVILGKINTAINDMNPAPNYSGYNLYCITQTDGSSHPTNTQNFAEGISKIVCDNRDDFDDFVDNQYAGDITTLTDAITGLQEPELTYAPFSITSADLIGTVYTKMFTGFTGILNAQDPSGADWGDISVSPAPETITDAFDEIIDVLAAAIADIATKQDELPNYDNSANCLADVGGTSIDTESETVDLLIDYICTLPKFDVGSIVFGSITAGADLQETVQNIITGVDYLYTNGVVAVGDSSLTLSSVGTTYQGKKLVVNPAWSGLFKVKVSSDDTTGDYIEAKIVAGDGISVTTNNPGGNETFEITNDAPADGKVLVDSSDTTSDYLGNKVGYYLNSDWAMYNNPIVLGEKLYISPGIDAETFFTNMMTYISNTPALFSQFQQLVEQTEGGSCDVPTGLTVVIDGTDFDLTWTASGTADSQNVKYREKNTVTWILTPNIVAANPQTSAATTATVENLNVNTVYQFAVDSVCSGGGTGTSNIYEMIIYDCQTLADEVVSQQISVTQNPMSTVDTIEYRLKDSGSVVVESVSATGASPQVTFEAVSADTYTVEWRMGTIVNGVTLWSDDASQLNAWCVSGSIVVS